MIGYYDDAPNINREEVEDWKWMKIEDVNQIWRRIRFYTVWFKIIFDEFYHFLEDHKIYSCREKINNRTLK
jgi:isopentenyl-diphosphate delta-isomerase